MRDVRSWCWDRKWMKLKSWCGCKTAFSSQAFAEPEPVLKTSQTEDLKTSLLFLLSVSVLMEEPYFLSLLQQISCEPAAVCRRQTLRSPQLRSSFSSHFNRLFFQDAGFVWHQNRPSSVRSTAVTTSQEVQREVAVCWGFLKLLPRGWFLFFPSSSCP